MHILQKCLLGAWTSFVLFSVSHAAVYSEAISGDLSNNQLMPTEIDPFSAGLNTISGSLSGECALVTESPLLSPISECLIGDFADYFIADIDPSLELASATATISNLTYDGDLDAFGAVEIFVQDTGSEAYLLVTETGIGPMDLDGMLTIFPDPFFPPSGFVPGSGIQAFTFILPPFLDRDVGFGNFALDYTLDLTFNDAAGDPIPLPAGFVLLATGLAGFASLRRFTSRVG